MLWIETENGDTFQYDLSAECLTTINRGEENVSLATNKALRSRN